MQQQDDQIVSLHFSILTKLCASTARARRSGWVFSARTTTTTSREMSCVRDGRPWLPAADSVVSPPLHILTFATGAYVRWLEHLHTNLRLLALPGAALSVCAGDEPSLQAARGLNTSTGLSIWDCRVDVLSTRRRQRLVGERFGTEAYLKIVHRKSTCILHQLRRLTSPSDILFFVDGDVTLFADPRPHFLSLGVDLALMSDVIELGSNTCVAGSTQQILLRMSNATANFNSGFFLLRNVPAAQGLWERMLEYHVSHPATRQQPALNHLLQAHDEGTSPHSSPSTSSSWTACSAQGPTRACTVSSLTFAALNEALFLNGFCFYIQRPLRQDSSKIVAVHHNYVEGDDRKYKRAVAYQTITSKADVDSTTFLRRARAAMGVLPAWESEVRVRPSTQRCNTTATGERSPNFRKSFQSCRTNTQGKKRSRNVASYVAPLCHHTPVALWSMPHSGANWLRMVLELSTGHSTASMFPNPALKGLMPSEEWPWEGPVPECGNMLALSIRGHIRGPAWTSIACGGVIARAIFLVRHPFAVAWSKFVSEFPAMANADAWSKLDPTNVNAAALASGHWHRHAMYTARLWVYLTAWDSLRLDSAYRVWMKLGRPFLWVRVEDLTDDARGQFVLRGALDFLLDGNYDISQPVLSCALKEAGPLLRRLDDRVAPNQNLIEHAFENTSHHTGDGMWRQVGPPATKLGYTRYSLYTGKV